MRLSSSEWLVLLCLAILSDLSTGPSYPGWVQHLGKAAYVDMTAVVVDLEDGKSSIRLSILNRHPEATWEGDLTFTGFDVEKVEVHELYSDDLTAVVSSSCARRFGADGVLQNSFENPENVVPKVTQFDASAWSKKEGKHTVQKHSWQFLIFEGKYKK